ncbi:MAG TPA: cob(I)yrinic acid a,c-diamide adenosyltransferase [Acidimicrobiia bacterium]|jgi:cob(I)alamin adenosyltransferase
MSDSSMPPTEGPEARHERAASLLLVNTGDGKGKSTAAFGTAMRAVARGWKVAVIQFIKSGDWKVGEEKVASGLGVDWWVLGDGFTWDSENMEESEAVARRAWQVAKEKIEAGDHRLVILDEITYPMNWGWIDTAEVVGTLRARPQGVSVILTGRDAPEALLEVADTVTEMRNVKHAFDQGIMAMRGIDY